MSEQKRYTAEDFHIAAQQVCDELYTNPFAAMLRQAADAEEELTQLKAQMKAVSDDLSFTQDAYAKATERLDAVVKECENEISKRNQTSKRCERCADDFSAGEGCPYHGEPNGCNSPTHGEFPLEKECGPFNEIIRAARGEGGAE